MGSGERTPTKHVRSTDVLIGGLDSIEHLDGGLVRVLLYCEKPIDGTLVRVPAPFDLVMPRHALTDGVALALSETGGYVLASSGGQLTLVE